MQLVSLLEKMKMTHLADQLEVVCEQAAKKELQKTHSIITPAVAHGYYPPNRTASLLPNAWKGNRNEPAFR